MLFQMKYDQGSLHADLSIAYVHQGMGEFNIILRRMLNLILVDCIRCATIQLDLWYIRMYGIKPV